MKIKKVYIAFFALILLFFVVGIYAYKATFSGLKEKGKVLGATINNIYSQKQIDTIAPPVKGANYTDLKISAESAILLRQTDKYPLFEKNSDQEVAIASITKVMTAIVALEKYKTDRVVEVKKENTEVIPSKIFLTTGEKITIENLLYGALVSSGNDAARALSTIDTTQAEFVELMNKKAQELGMAHTKFSDPAGLDDSGRSSARDIAIMFSYGMNNDLLKKIIGTKDATIKSVDGAQVHELKNSNRLLTGEIPIEGNVIGGKTGVTDAAGHTLVCAVERENNILISVVLKTLSEKNTASAEESKKLLDWGFASYILN